MKGTDGSAHFMLVALFVVISFLFWYRHNYAMEACLATGEEWIECWDTLR